MTDVAETTLQRITHDEVFKLFWVEKLFNAKPYSPATRKFNDAQLIAAVRLHGSQVKAARALGISETSISYRLGLRRKRA